MLYSWDRTPFLHHFSLPLANGRSAHSMESYSDTLGLPQHMNMSMGQRGYQSFYYRNAM